MKRRIVNIIAENFKDLPEREVAVMKHLREIDPEGFCWGYTQVRANIKGAILLLSRDEQVIARFISEVSDKLDNSFTDQDVLDTLYINDGTFGPLCDMVLQWAPTLWPNESEEFHLAFRQAFYNVISHIYDEYETQVDLLGDPSGDVEDQIAYYLQIHMNLPVSSCCGILSNILYASKFDAGCLNMQQTHFGLLGWEWERRKDLEAYNRDHLNLDPYALYTQLEYLKNDLEQNFKGLLAELQNMPETADAASHAGLLFAFEYRHDGKVSRGLVAKKVFWPRYSAEEYD